SRASERQARGKTPQAGTRDRFPTCFPGDNNAVTHPKENHRFRRSSLGGAKAQRKACLFSVREFSWQAKAPAPPHCVFAERADSQARSAVRASFGDCMPILTLVTRMTSLEAA